MTKEDLFSNKLAVRLGNVCNLRVWYPNILFLVNQQNKLKLLGFKIYGNQTLSN